MLEGQRPRRPVVTSQASAQEELSQWLAANRFDTVTDGDGLTWNVELHVHQRANLDSPRGLIWEIQLTAEKAATVEDLVATRVLAPDTDRRLIGLIGPRIIQFRIASPPIHAPSEADARSLWIEALPGFVAKLKAATFNATKRKCVCSWVDDQTRLAPTLQSATIDFAALSSRLDSTPGSELNRGFERTVP